MGNYFLDIQKIQDQKHLQILRKFRKAFIKQVAPSIMAFSQETYRGCQKDKKYVRDQSKLLIDCKNIYQQSTRKTNMPFLKAELNPTSFSFITTGLFTVCPGSDPFYIVKLLYKMGHYFPDRRYIHLNEEKNYIFMYPTPPRKSLSFRSSLTCHNFSSLIQIQVMADLNFQLFLHSVYIQLSS